MNLSLSVKVLLEYLVRILMKTFKCIPTLKSVGANFLQLIHRKLELVCSWIFLPLKCFELSIKNTCKESYSSERRKASLKGRQLDFHALPMAWNSLMLKSRQKAPSGNVFCWRFHRVHFQNYAGLVNVP